MNENLREKFARNETAFGLWVTSESPAVTEIAALLGIDWICIDMEHGYLSHQHIANHLMAARGSEMSVLVRPPSHALEPTKRALDLGAHGIILPLVQSAEELEAAKQNVFYPPIGERGIGGERSVSWGLNLPDYVARANDEVLLIPMIETRHAVEHFDAITDTPDIDAIFLGPGDMSASYGHIGEWEGPGIAEMHLDLVQRAEAKGIKSGIVSRFTEEAIQRRDQGFGMVSLGSDLGLMIRQIKSMASALDKETTGHKWF